MNERYGQWTVVEEAGRAKGQRMVKARCDCGNERVVRLNHLTSGASMSCHGAGTGNYKHGHTAGARSQTNRRTPEHTAWSSMKARCSNEKNPKYHDYGGRGIRVCERWQASFGAFLADMGLRPSAKHSIDRFPDNDGHYEPGNCRWATVSEQNFNKRPLKLTDAMVREIRTSTESSRIVAARFGISKAVVQATRRGDLHSQVKP